MIIADIRLPDMTGYELMVKLQELVDVVPMVLMTGFGWDPGHSIVKARQAGLQAVLYKPFRLDQLLGAIEQIIHRRGPWRKDSGALPQRKMDFAVLSLLLLASATSSSGSAW